MAYKAIIGLGNPGAKYEKSLHNMGFQVLDRLLRRYQVGLGQAKHRGLLGKGVIQGQSTLFLAPQTYMNLSGESVRSLVTYYRLAPQDILVIYDDIDLDPGRLRLRKGGSAGTHNGMRSIIYQLQYDDFPRLRVGVGRPRPGQDLADYVLSTPGKEAGLLLEQALDGAAQAAHLWLTQGVEPAMQMANRFGIE